MLKSNQRDRDFKDPLQTNKCNRILLSPVEKNANDLTQACETPQREFSVVLFFTVRLYFSQFSQSYFCLLLREEEIKKAAQGLKPFLYGIVAVDLKHLIGHLLKECIKPALQEPKSFTIFYIFLTVALKKERESMDSRN